MELLIFISMLLECSVQTSAEDFIVQMMQAEHIQNPSTSDYTIKAKCKCDSLAKAIHFNLAHCTDLARTCIGTYH